MKSSMKRSGFGFQTWKFQKLPKSLILECGKDPCLPFHFHVLSLFKSWSNLGFDQQDSNEHKNSEKNQKK